MTTHPSTPGPARGAARSAILDAAQRLFASRGIGATSTAAIAREAGVANGLIFYHFGGKDQLVDSLIAERTFGPELRRLLADTTEGDAQAVLELVGRAFLSVLDRRCEIASILLQEVATQRRTAHLPTIIDGAISVLAEHLQRVEADVDESQARLAARLFLSTLLVAGVMLGPEDDTDDFVTRVASSVVRGAIAPGAGSA